MIGGGPAGATAAAVSARHGLRTMLFEAHLGPCWKPGETLAPECNPALARLGIRPHLAARPDVAVRSAGVRSQWGAPETSFRDGFREPMGAGWIIDRPAFEGLLAELAISAGVEWVWGARIGSAVRSRAGWRLHGSGPTAGEYRARVIIDATGRPACIARRLGARRIPYESQIAYIAAGRSPGLAKTAWTSVESMPDGWWYAVSGPLGVQTLARFTDISEAETSRLAAYADARHSIARTRLIRRLASLPPRTALAHEKVVSAGSAALDSAAGEGWLAVGDAAMAFDPISSQGLPNAITSGEAAACAVHAWMSGDEGALNAYEAKMNATYMVYRRGLASHYRSEMRWPDRPFWRIRQEAGLR